MQGVLVFLAAGARLAVSVGDVLKLIVETDITPVPFGHRALAGVMPGVDGVDDVVPVFDLRGLTEDAPRPPRHVAGATVAVIPTAIGPIGLRLDRLLGTAARYAATTASIPPHIARVIDGAAVATDGASDDVAGDTFYFFSTEAFIAAIGVNEQPR